MKKPPALRPGSRVRIVAPASPPDSVKVAAGVKHLRGMGFEISRGDLLRRVRQSGYLAGSDEERADDLHTAFEDPNVDGIVCANGGYGCLRILPRLDYETIARTPKPFVGFSDVTALHIALTQLCGFVTFHGPMASVEDSSGLERRWTRESMQAALCDPKPLGGLREPPDGPFLRSVAGGRASGALTGGNLSLVAATLGTPWEIDTHGRVLFLEEWREPPFTVETLLMQLRHAGKLADAAAIVFGEFVQCEPQGHPSPLVDEVIRDVTADLGIPVLLGLAAGHGRENATLPMGVRATVDADEVTFTLNEPATVQESKESSSAYDRTMASGG